MLSSGIVMIGESGYSDNELGTISSTSIGKTPEHPYQRGMFAGIV